eukprot:CAMPEP_0117655834 /NCGR_PEP_ID=MMETSP0804-20121206/4488_1 /TAXON_ID=1074897 /ORGANISM="Tetraselmis astigmatica, Strain CCMP880" /LENGTH=83 /DNA_ID=CAMNT_0005462207 /DNA_START=118 /DNA_END=369 /DNA_ORIENTATION=-
MATQHQSSSTQGQRTMAPVVHPCKRLHVHSCFLTEPLEGVGLRVAVELPEICDAVQVLASQGKSSHFVNILVSLAVVGGEAVP